MDPNNDVQFDETDDEFDFIMREEEKIKKLPLPVLPPDPKVIGALDVYDEEEIVRRIHGHERAISCMTKINGRHTTKSRKSGLSRGRPASDKIKKSSETKNQVLVPRDNLSDQWWFFFWYRSHCTSSIEPIDMDCLHAAFIQTFESTLSNYFVILTRKINKRGEETLCINTVKKLSTEAYKAPKNVDIVGVAVFGIKEDYLAQALVSSGKTKKTITEKLLCVINYCHENNRQLVLDMAISNPESPVYSPEAVIAVYKINQLKKESLKVK